jgi:two-component system NtrC family sensor kinase
VLLNRNFEIVDKVVQTVFRDRVYRGRGVGTATIFQDDVRISTNVLDAGGARAVTTRVSAEVADAVLGQGQTWRDRAFVVNDWYLSAYAPIVDSRRRTVGMLYVGLLEQPYTDLLWRTLAIFLGIAVRARELGVRAGRAARLAADRRLPRARHR